MSDFAAMCARIHEQWHERAKARDTEALLALYAPDASLEIMEIEDELIGKHRIYWGWVGTELLIRNAVEKAKGA